MTVSRDPADYSPTIHALQRSKFRGIEMCHVAECIENGNLQESKRPGCKLFILDHAAYSQPIYCVADIDAGEVVTVGYRQD